MNWTRPNWQYFRPEEEQAIVKELRSKGHPVGPDFEELVEKLLRERHTEEQLEKIYEPIWKGHPF